MSEKKEETNPPIKMKVPVPMWFILLILFHIFSAVYYRDYFLPLHILSIYLLGSFPKQPLVWTHVVFSICTIALVHFNFR